MFWIWVGKFVRLMTFPDTDFHIQNFLHTHFHNQLIKVFKNFLKNLQKFFFKFLLVFFKCFVKFYQIFLKYWSPWFLLGLDFMIKIFLLSKVVKINPPVTISRSHRPSFFIFFSITFSTLYTSDHTMGSQTGVFSFFFFCTK